jgi:Bacterial type II and III secretion system protein
MVVIAALTAPSPAVAQEKPTLVPLKVQLVVSRHNGDKKISSLPYKLWVTANGKNTTGIRMGVQVPIPTTVVTKEGVTSPSYNYRDIGTNIDCNATSQADGFYSLEIKVNDSSVSFDTKESGSTLKGIPAFRNFTSTFSILVKDGQTAQYASATDPLTGETLKVDVTLNVLK